MTTAKNSFETKVVLVTGAAQGIGQRIAQSFHEQGATVLVSDVNQQQAAETTELLGKNTKPLKLDVTQERDWLEAVSHIEQTHGRLDVLVNNAGIGTTIELEDLTLEIWNQMLAINTTSVFLGCKLCTPLLRQSSTAAVVNIASIFGGRPRTTAMHYSASKAAVLSLTRNFAMFYAERNFGIRCNAIQPGVIRTAMLENAVDASPEPGAFMAELEGLHPIGNIGETIDIAEAALYLASDSAKFITGASLAVDGGFLAA